MLFELIPRRQFLRDVSRLKKSGWPMKPLTDLLNHLRVGPPFPPKYQIHELQGELAGVWDAHIRQNWVVLFRYRGKSIELSRTGTHASLKLS